MIKTAYKVSNFAALWGVMFLSAICADAAGSGSIRGSVKDNDGKPLPGAAVIVAIARAEKSAPEKVIKRVNTDADGKFVASNLLPGRYRIKAEAAGFDPVELAAVVEPNKVTVFDSILLRRTGTLEEEITLNGTPRYAARSARGTIFHVAPEKSDQNYAVCRQMDGLIYAFSQSGPGSHMGTSFAISQSIGDVADVVVSGQAGDEQRLQAAAATASGPHKLSVAIGYSRLTILRRGATEQLGQFSLSATDSWQISGPVFIVYGLELSRFADADSVMSLLPRLEVGINMGAKARLFGGIIPSSSADEQSRFKLDSADIVFPEAKLVAIMGSKPVADRSYRVQLGGEKVLADGSRLEVMAFFDEVSGRGLEFIAVPLGQGEIKRHVAEQKGRAKGLRFVYHRRLNHFLEGTFGYAIADGEYSIGPARFFMGGLLQVASAKIDAYLIRTGTRVSTVVRVAPERAYLTLDPFRGRIGAYNPNLSLLLVQELPSMGFLPGQLAALLDVRNLFDQVASVSDEQQELIAGRFGRQVRVGLALRF
jgi:hypothetical protein